MCSSQIRRFFYSSTSDASIAPVPIPLPREKYDDTNNGKNSGVFLAVSWQHPVVVVVPATRSQSVRVVDFLAAHSDT